MAGIAINRNATVVLQYEMQLIRMSLFFEVHNEMPGIVINRNATVLQYEMAGNG